MLSRIFSVGFSMEYSEFVKKVTESDFNTTEQPGGDSGST